MVRYDRDSNVAAVVGRADRKRYEDKKTLKEIPHNRVVQ